MPGATTHLDLDTFRHSAANLLIYKQIRAEVTAVRPRKDLLPRLRIVDDTIITVDKCIATLGSHHRNVMALVQRFAIMCHYPMQLIHQRAFAPSRQVQPLRIVNLSHRLRHLPGLYVVRHAHELDDQNLRAYYNAQDSFTIASAAFTGI